VPRPNADNGAFLINALDNLSGSSDLISLRSRGRFARPFDRVGEIRRAAEDQFRAKEEELEAALRTTEDKLAELQGKKEGASRLVLSPEQQLELEQFQEERVRLLRERREVRHQLRKDIERLGTRLKLANVFLIPAAITLIALGLWSYRSRRRSAP
jgi:ABC-type uncharacterized transport system involved in gliding motility auxiliary subunit